MRRLARSTTLLLVLSLLLALTASGCAVQKRAHSNALDFLYPKGAEAAPPSDVTLKLPVRVGVAFAPAASGWQDAFTENQKQRLLERVAAAFRDRDFIAGIDVIPSDMLSPGGGFENVDRLRAAFGIDLITLVSYDQFQFSSTTRRGWTYLTLVGAYFINGEKHETRTVLNATIYDVPSRAMLFHATGDSTVGGRSAPVSVQRDLRARSAQGYSEATDALIAQLDDGLAAFREQAASGTVRGAGTPALAIYDAAGKEVSGGGGGGGGAGALGPVEVGLAALAGLAALVAARRRTR